MSSSASSTALMTLKVFNVGTLLTMSEKYTLSLSAAVMQAGHRPIPILVIISVTAALSLAEAANNEDMIYLI